MGGGGMDDFELVYPSKRTLVLIGRSGNGRSATGNSILGKNVFESARRLSGVTKTCELQKTTMTDHLAVNVIDTPGLFDSAARSHFSIGREIVKCVDLAQDGIDAVLVVLSAGCRFSCEDEAAIRILQNLFGDKISNYMVVVFTGGDEIPSLPDFLANGCPDTLERFISLCGGRVVLFDNRTTDGNKKHQQVRDLMSLVDDVLSQNGGQPLFIHEYLQVKNGDLNSLEVQHCSNLLKAQEQRIEKMTTEMIELKIKEETCQLEEWIVKILTEKNLNLFSLTHEKPQNPILEEQCVEEHVAGQSHEEAQRKSNDEIEKLSVNLESQEGRVKKMIEMIELKVKDGTCKRR